MTILVTGGSGFIGSNFIINYLSTYNNPIINLDKLSYSGNKANLASIENNSLYSFFEGDIGDFELVGLLLAKFKPVAIINFAAESHVDRSISSPKVFVDTNIVGTFNLLETVRKYWVNLSVSEKSKFKFLHISTDEVYGSLENDQPSFTENHPYKPNSPYSASKAASDHLVRSYFHTYGLPVLTTNCSNNYGPRQFPEKLIPLIIHRALAGEFLPIYGNGKQRRDWIYVDDHCDALFKVLDKGRLGQTYNIGSSCELTNIFVVTTICKYLDSIQPKSDGKKYKELIKFVRDRPGHDRRYSIDSTKINRELGWQPRESFQSAIEKTITWYLQNYEWSQQVAAVSYGKWLAEQYS